MINLSIQHFIPFLIPPLFPSKLRSIKEKEGLKPGRTLWGPPRYKSPSVSPIPCFQKKIFSLLCLPRVSRTSYWLGEWRNAETKEKKSRNNSSVIKLSPSSCSRIHITNWHRSLSCSAGTKTLIQVENGDYLLIKSTQTSDCVGTKVDDKIPKASSCYLSSNQS